MHTFTLFVTTEGTTAIEKGHALINEVNTKLVTDPFFRYDTSLTSHHVDDVSTEDSREYPSDRMAEFKTLEILCRLGMTETEAHTALNEMHEAKIRITYE